MKKKNSTILRSLVAFLVLCSCTETDVNVNLTPDPTTDLGSVVHFPDTRNATDTLGSLCTTDQDCWPVSVCIDGVCARECVTSEECKATGGLCKDWRCSSQGTDMSAPPDVQAPEELPPPSEDTQTPVPDPGQPVPDLGPVDVTPQDQGSTSKKGYGDPCTGASECESDLCVALGGTQGFCTQECQNTANCPTGHGCYPVGQGTSICAPSDAGVATSCPAPSCFGLSLDNGMGACACTHSCQTASDCPGVMACSYVATPTGNQKMCIPVGELCSPDPLNACFQLCYPETTTQGFCTATCENTLDCPSGSPCLTDQLPDGSSIQTCQ